MRRPLASPCRLRVRLKNKQQKTRSQNCAGPGDNFPGPAFFCASFDLGVGGHASVRPHERAENGVYFSIPSLNLLLIDYKLTDFIGFSKKPL